MTDDERSILLLRAAAVALHAQMTLLRAEREGRSRRARLRRRLVFFRWLGAVWLINRIVDRWHAAEQRRIALCRSLLARACRANDETMRR